MKDLFKWYFPFTDEEMEKVWNDGILSVDANVLLDIYRYHETTRKAILRSLKEFEGRAWLTYQVADEFFRNRNNVIVSAENSFRNGQKSIEEIKSIVNEPLKKISSNRIVPDNIEIELRQKIDSALEDASKRIAEIEAEYPDYRDEDPILDQICKLFENNIGRPFNEDELVEEIKKGKKRIEMKIPPGFMDSKKEGDDKYGDYFVWRQLMNHIKQTNKPLIFVTSEQKEDWWEKRSGKTIGPLYNLLKEFYEDTNQRFKLYRTDRFLEYALSRSEGNNNGDSEEAIAEVREVAKQRNKDRTITRIVKQEIEIATFTESKGQITIELLQPSFKFTCSGQFKPRLKNVPELNAKLISSPPSVPDNFVSSGTGTKFDFNIHIKSTELNMSLPTGEYVFEYEALVEEETSNDGENIEQQD